VNGPRFFPSGRRFGPYFSRRLDASAAPSPFSVLVASFLTTSSTSIAYQATISLAVSAFVGAVMIGFPVLASRSVAKTKSADVMQCSRKRDKISGEANRSESQGRIGPRSYVRKNELQTLWAILTDRRFAKYR